MRIAFLLVPLSLFAQDQDSLSARRLYYQDNAPEVVFKATTVAQKPGEVKPVAAKPVVVAQKPATRPAPVLAANVNKAQEIEKIQKELREASATALTNNHGAPALKPAANLGVRYNILKVDAASGNRTEVPADTVFHEKDCVSIRIQPNRGGYLYVFTEESSGRFRPLLPSEEMADESTIVTAYNLMDVPQKNCFEMDDQPGTERLLFVVTDKPEDVMKLNDSIKNKTRGNLDIAQADMKPFTAALASRDLKITRIGNKTAAGEAPYSTYLVNAAATTADRLVLEIKLKHEK